MVVADKVSECALAPVDILPLKPFIDAVVEAVGYLIDDDAAAAEAAREEALKRVRGAKVRLARQGDPAGIMSGDGICLDEEDNNAPTLHRAQRDEFEIVATSHATGRDRSSEAWRVVPTIERMRRNGQITDEEYKAAQDFHKYFILGHRVGGLTMRYGELIGAGGTPPGQQVDQINTRGDVR